MTAPLSGPGYLRVTTALDDLTAEATTMEREQQDVPRFPRPPRRCRECGAIGGHTSVHCPGNED